ncbi:MAG: glycosyltransferase [Parachlamydiaceae bacterium]
MKRIDVFMPPLSAYGVLHYFTQKMHEGLQRCGVSSRLLEAKKDDPKTFLTTLFDNPPECTLSFNGLLPDDQGRFFCDMIRIPHVACLVDSPNSFLPLVRSERTIITCVDNASVDFFKGMGFQRALFMPHAVQADLAPDSGSKRDYDVVMLSSCIDYEGIRSSWKNKYPAPLRKAMEDAAEATLEHPQKPYYQTFAESIDKQISSRSGIDPQGIDFPTVLDDIEMYIRGKDRVELLKNIKDAKVDVFGASDGSRGWKKYLEGHKNIVIHDPVPFEQALLIMKHSKIVLNSCPWITYGGHERIFSGIACGALVLTNENAFLNKEFSDGESIVFYRHGRWDKANHRVNEYLANESKRESVVAKGRSIVMKFHTWDQRAAQLIKELPIILKMINKA